MAYVKKLYNFSVSESVVGHDHSVQVTFVFKEIIRHNSEIPEPGFITQATANNAPLNVYFLATNIRHSM
jgi:hypothetical protein